MTQLPIAIALSPFVGSLLMPILGRRWQALCYPLALLAMSGSAFAALTGLFVVHRQGPMLYAFGGWAPPIGIAWLLDGLSALIGATVSVSLLVSLVGLQETIRQELRDRLVPFLTLTLLLATGLLGIVLSADLFNLFVFLEVSSLSAYAMIAVSGPAGRLAAFRYLIMGSIGTSCYLIGIGQLYALTGSLNMADVAARLPTGAAHPMVLWSLVFIVIGLGLKAAIMPFHGWLPNAYSAAPSATSALIAPIMTKVALYALIRILGWVVVDRWNSDALLMVGLRAGGMAAVILGSLWALRQTNLRRLLAYSSVAQIGLIAMGISFANPSGLMGAVLHLINDVCAKGCLFLSASGIMLYSRSQTVKGIARLRGAPRGLWVAFTVAALSVVGIPPLLGFFSKWSLLLGALAAGTVPAAALIVASALLSALYVFRILEQLLAHNESAHPQRVAPHPRLTARLPWTMQAALNGLAAALVLFGLTSHALIAWLSRHALPLSWR